MRCSSPCRYLLWSVTQKTLRCSPWSSSEVRSGGFPPQKGTRAFHFLHLIQWHCGCFVFQTHLLDIFQYFIHSMTHLPACLCHMFALSFFVLLGSLLAALKVDVCETFRWVVLWPCVCTGTRSSPVSWTVSARQATGTSVWKWRRRSGDRDGAFWACPWTKRWRACISNSWQRLPVSHSLASPSRECICKIWNDLWSSHPLTFSSQMATLQMRCSDSTPTYPTVEFCMQ